MVTARILEQLEKGVIPWNKPWTGTNGAYSRATGKNYSLLNQWLMPSGEYATYNQIKKEGGKVLKGAKGYQVVFFKPQPIEQTDSTTGEKTIKYIPLLKYFTVFQIGVQTEGTEVKHTKESREIKPLSDLEQIKDDYLKRTGVKFRNVAQDRAYYSPLGDSITLPLMEQFENIEEYYSTAFHEMAHSTGHPSKMNDIAAFGSDDYGKEELVAEITASAVLNECGIETKGTFRNSTAYIQNWKESIKADVKLVVHASSKAQKAYEMIMGIEQ